MYSLILDEKRAGTSSKIYNRGPGPSSGEIKILVMISISQDCDRDHLTVLSTWIEWKRDGPCISTCWFSHAHSDFLSILLSAVSIESI